MWTFNKTGARVYFRGKFFMRVLQSNDSIYWEIVVDQFSWHSSVALPHEFASPTKRNLERGIFVMEAENGRIHELNSPRINKTLTIHESWPHEFKWYNSKSLNASNGSPY